MCKLMGTVLVYSDSGICDMRRQNVLPVIWTSFFLVEEIEITASLHSFAAVAILLSASRSVFFARSAF